jgi:hypothetical protein
MKFSVKVIFVFCVVGVSPDAQSTSIFVSSSTVTTGDVYNSFMIHFIFPPAKLKIPVLKRSSEQGFLHFTDPVHASPLNEIFSSVR